MTGLRNKFGNQFNRISIIGSFFTLIWIVLTGIYIKNVLNAYNSTSLPSSLLIIDSFFFAGLIVLISIVVSMSGTRDTFLPAALIVNNLLNLSGGVAILVIANISAYFTTGLLHIIAIYYQIWTLPAFMTLFYSDMPFNNIMRKT